MKSSPSIPMLVLAILFYGTPILAQGKPVMPVESSAPVAVSSGQLDIVIQAYLPMDFIQNPSYPALSKYYKFCGDGKGGPKKGKARMWQQVVVDLAKVDPLVARHYGTGMSVGYYKVGGKEQSDTRKPSTKTLFQGAIRHHEKVVVTFNGAAGNPLVTGSPTIDYQFQIELIPGEKGKFLQYKLKGGHDGYPNLAVWIGSNLVYHYEFSKHNGGLADLFPPLNNQVVRKAKLPAKGLNTPLQPKPLKIDPTKVEILAQAFVPDKTIANRGYPLTSTYRKFVGDNRSHTRKGTSRLSNGATVDLTGKTPPTVFQKAGISKGHYRTWRGREKTATGRSSTRDMVTKVEGKGQKWKITLVGSGSNPLQRMSPSVDYRYVITLEHKGNHLHYQITASHDGFPNHSLWIGPVLVYSYDYKSFGRSGRHLFPPTEEKVSLQGAIPVK